ncbi:MAG TPA: hypothetical protein VFC19_40775 [Candidatus Limnocylindrales bacterium]|nr:hypothetical protein [Candidatus Limnocylindrales bacterium]
MMETALDAVRVLARRYSFAEVAALLAAGMDGASLDTRTIAQLEQLCAFGQRLMELDAEDFGAADATVSSNVEHEVAARFADATVPPALRKRALECRMPQAPRETPRGALSSLHPTFRLLLEVIDVRFRRGETMGVVAAAHIACEYAPLLVWERVLGHAGDPALMADAVGGKKSSWGHFEDRGCPHTKAEKSAAKRVLHVSQENVVGWRAYLDRQHSVMSHALATCAASCPRPCTVYTRLSPREAETVTIGSRIALSFNGSAIIRLRHSAPVGHGFGVPSRAEVLEAWERTRESMARLAPSVAADDGFVLPGFNNLVSTLAGVRLEQSTLIADTATAIIELLATSAAEPD